MKISIRWPIILGSILLVCGTHFIIVPYYYMLSERVLTNHALAIMENISSLTLEQSENHTANAAKLAKKMLGFEVFPGDEKGKAAYFSSS